MVDPNAVAILPFRVSGPPEAQYLREGMLDLLNVALDGFAGWRVIQPRAFLRRVGTNATPIDVPQASRLAREAGAATFVLGSVIALGPELRVQAELYESARGTPIATVRAHGTLALPAPVADSIAGGLSKQRIGQYSGVARRPLAEYTTTSPAALQAYLVAEQLARRARWQEAAESLTAALTRDSTFALAYYGLYRAISWGNVGSIMSTTPLNLLAIIQAPIPYLDRAPTRQRRLLEFIVSAFSANRAWALQRADDLARDYPDDADVALERGDAYFHIGLQSGEPPLQALESLRRAIELDPAVPEAYLHVVQLLCMMGDTTGAWESLARLKAVAPNWNAAQAMDLVMRAGLHREDPATLPVPDAVVAVQVGRYALWALDGTPARAVALADSFAALAASPDHAASERVLTMLRRHVYRLAQGKNTAAWDMLREAAAMPAAGPEVLGATVLHHIVTGAHAAEAAEAARRLVALGDEPPLWVSAVLAWRLAAVGRQPPDSTRAAIQRLLAGKDFLQFRSALSAGLTGLVMLRTGDSVGARRGLAAANVVWTELRNIEEFFPNPSLALVMARLDVVAGDLDVAERRLSETIGPIGIAFRANAEELRAQIAERRADTTGAIRAYRSFIDLWKDADPELQPRVMAARAALARLERR